MRPFEFQSDEIGARGRMIIDLDAIIRLEQHGDKWRVVFADGWYELKSEAAFERLVAGWKGR